MMIWKCPSRISLFHHQSWWCASFWYSFNCNSMPTSVDIHISKDDDMKMSFRYIFAPQSVFGELLPFIIHSNATICPHRSISIFQRMKTWRRPSSISLRHFSSWWIAFFCHSFKCNYMTTPINIHVSKNDNMKMSFRYIFAPQSVLVILHRFFIHSNATIRPHRSISIFQRMMTWKCSSGTSWLHN